MMSLDEARKVLWLKSNPKPLGLLLDEGYLNQEKLEWAATHAYNPTLQQAAKVLLESQKHATFEKKVEGKPAPAKPAEKAVAIPIGLEKARATPWPFGAYRGQPMGTLVDSKQLSLKDLGYAIDNAQDNKVRQAAIALSLVRLDQAVKEPMPSAGFVRLVSGGRSYSERKETWLTLLEGMVFGFLLAFMLFVVGMEIINIRTPHPNAKPLAYFLSSPSGIIALAIVLVLMIILVWLIGVIPDQITKRLDKQIEESRLGQEGEDRVTELILQALDGNWFLFRNIGLPGRNKGDLDLVLVGPPGVWVLEVKNFRGQYRNVGETWEYRQGKRWKPAPANPSRQAFKDALRLKNFLNADNVKVFVNAAVVWANQESPLLVENPSVAVWKFNRLPEELGNIWQGEKLSEQERKKITDKLSKLCEEQKKSY